MTDNECGMLISGGLVLLVWLYLFARGTWNIWHGESLWK